MNAEALCIRPGRTSDGPALAELVRRCLLEYGLPPDPDGVDADLLDVERHYVDTGGWFEVLEAGGRVVGCAGMYKLASDTLELRKMYFAPALRGHGWGSALLARLLERARREGWRRVHLETASVLTEAIALYEHFGFRRYPGDPDVQRCDVVMELELAGADWPRPRHTLPECPTVNSGGGRA